MEKTKRSSKAKAPVAPPALQTMRPTVAGIDVGSREHWVCGPARTDGQPNVRVFGTTTDQLEELMDWLLAQGVESVRPCVPFIVRWRTSSRRRPAASYGCRSPSTK